MTNTNPQITRTAYGEVSAGRDQAPIAIRVRISAIIGIIRGART